MKFKEFVKNLYVNTKEGISRFLIAFICTVLSFFTLSFQIIFETESEKIIYSLCIAFGTTAVLSVLLKILQEYITDKLNKIIQYIICSLAAISGFILIYLNYESIYTSMVYSGVTIAMICFIFSVLMREKNYALAFPKLVSSWIFSIAVCGVISGGLSTCIAAFQLLIFNCDDIYKVYSIVNLLIWTVGFINLFLSFIPKKEIPATQSKIFRIFVLFAGLPLYILLIAILLVYLAKIVITFNMPVGEINWFASFASLFFIFFLLSVMQYEEKIAKLYVKYGGYFLFPVLIMQAIAVFERINAYGLTTPRTVSLVLIVISILFILGSVIIPKQLNKIAFLSAIIVLIVTVTPLNVIDMPVKSQTGILTSVLNKNNMLKDGKVIPEKNVNEGDAKKIISAFNYLKYNAKKTPDYIQDSNKTTEEIFGFTPKDYDREGNSYVHCNFRTKDSIDITGYDKLLKVYDDDNFLKFTHNGKDYNIDLKNIAKELYEAYGSENSELDVYQIDENLSLIFSDFSFSMENDEITYCYMGGYALLKN